MSGFIRQGQTELTTLLFAAEIGAAVGVPISSDGSIVTDSG